MIRYTHEGEVDTCLRCNNPFWRGKRKSDYCPDCKKVLSKEEREEKQRDRNRIRYMNKPLERYKFV